MKPQNSLEKEILKEFDKLFYITSDTKTLIKCGGETLGNATIDDLKDFISSAIKRTREEMKKELEQALKMAREQGEEGSLLYAEIEAIDQSIKNIEGLC